MNGGPNDQLLMPRRRVSLNLSAIFEKIEELIPSDRAVGECMGEIIAMCSKDAPHADWARLAAIDYDSDVESLKSWIGNIFKEQPAPFPIQGLWIGLCNPVINDKASADMYVASFSQYSSDDAGLSWLWKDPRHYPEDAYANSSSLHSILRNCLRIADDGLGNELQNNGRFAWHFAVLAVNIERYLTKSDDKAARIQRAVDRRGCWF